MLVKTQGLYAVEQRGFAVKDNQDNGWIIDWKLLFSKEAREETRFDLDAMPVVIGAAKTDGLKLIVTPMTLGQELPPLSIPVDLMGSVSVTDEGAVTFTARMKKSAMEATGAGFDMVMNASLTLECVVGEMESLEEQAERSAVGGVDVEPLLGDKPKGGRKGKKTPPDPGGDSAQA